VDRWDWHRSTAGVWRRERRAVKDRVAADARIDEGATAGPARPQDRHAKGYVATAARRATRADGGASEQRKGHGANQHAVPERVAFLDPADLARWNHQF